MRERNNARHAQTNPVGQSQQTAGYVPRNRQQPGATAGLLSAGMTSAGMLSNGGRRPGTQDQQQQQLDAESVEALARLKAEDAEIDQGLDAISQNLDMIGRIAADMNSEVG